MSQAGLTREQATALLRRLSSDDAFRARFQSSPVDGLIELGVSKEVAAAIPSSAMDPSQLADTATLQQLANQLSRETAENFRCMVIPGPRCGFGK